MQDVTHSQDLANSARVAGGPALPGLVLVHPAIKPDALRGFLSDIWFGGSSETQPPGFRDISCAFVDLRAFCREDLAAFLPDADLALAARVREWVDALAHQWAFSEVFAVRGLNCWTFMRDRMIAWAYERMAERRVIEHLAHDGKLAVVGVGLDPHRRALLRGLAEGTHGHIRSEIAFAGPPQPEPGETLAGRRARKLFFLVQDAWHGVQLLVEDICLRRPKVLFISATESWKRTRVAEGAHPRAIDMHLESVWREGRRRKLRLYYRTESYHPDVGAMTGGRLAPTNLRHFLFLLAQTSRGFWEVRRIERQWRQLREKASFREALLFDGFSLEEMILSWLDHETVHQLPEGVRDTRRETHFLKGVRPDAILLAREQDANRPVLTAARRLGIPTVAVQLRPFQLWDHAYFPSRRDPEGSACLPDRLCVFSQEAKAILVEQGAFDPSRIVVTGDPRRELIDAEVARRAEVLPRVRRQWGVEGARKVIALACRPAQAPEILTWLAEAVAGREDAFVLLHAASTSAGQVQLYRQSAAGHNLPWFHYEEREGFSDWLSGVDLLVTTSWPELAEALLRRTPTVLIQSGECAGFLGPDPGDLVMRVRSAAELRQVVADQLARPDNRLPANAAWQAFADAMHGTRGGGAAQRIMDVAAALARKS